MTLSMGLITVLSHLELAQIRISMLRLDSSNISQNGTSDPPICGPLGPDYPPVMGIEWDDKEQRLASWLAILYVYQVCKQMIQTTKSYLDRMIELHLVITASKTTSDCSDCYACTTSVKLNAMWANFLRHAWDIAEKIPPFLEEAECGSDARLIADILVGDSCAHGKVAINDWRGHRCAHGCALEV